MATIAKSSMTTSMAAFIGSAAAVLAFQMYRTAVRSKETGNGDGDVAHRCVTITLPEWATDETMYEREYETDEDRMALAIQLSAKNVEEGTGGPFGCAIFERDVATGITKLFSVGVNRVVPMNNSTLHGETVAIQMAQSKLRCYSLGKAGQENPVSKVEYDLYTSCEPCVMCLGATLWSGVTRLICGATKDDAQAIGFDEGPVFESSYEHLRQAGIEVKKGVLQKEAAAVLKKYGEVGEIYNGS